MLKTRFFQKLPKAAVLGAPVRNSTKNWRTQIKEAQLVSQVSTIVSQRHSKFWDSLIRPLGISANISPSFFQRVLKRNRGQPIICLHFFNWAQRALDFKPGLKEKCELARVLFESELSSLGVPILDSIIQDHPPANIVPLLIQSHGNADFGGFVSIVNSLIDCYCREQLHLECLEVYQVANRYNVALSVGSCISLLKLLAEKNEFRLAWFCYASMIRNGVLRGSLTWLIAPSILHKEGKFDGVVRIFNLGVCSNEMFELVIDIYSKRGEFEAAFACLNDMCRKEIKPSFSVYSTMLDGACEFHNRKVTEDIISSMVVKGIIPEPSASSYDLIISKLCDSGKTFAADLFYKRACEENVELDHATFESMFRALCSAKGRIKDAIKLHEVIQEKNATISNSCYTAFVASLCEENPSPEISSLLVQIVGRGLVPVTEEVSGYVRRQCLNHQWEEAGELLNLALDKGCLLDSHSYGAFIRHYCYDNKLDKAIELQIKLERLKGLVDPESCNVFLDSLFADGRKHEALKVFDYFKSCKILNCGSFCVAISGLCHEKEMRKAMQLHDEMLELGLKPDPKTYRRLISICL